jgi:hypothetical protein
MSLHYKCGGEFVAIEGPREDGASLYACNICGLPIGWKDGPRPKIQRTQPATVTIAPQFGPGTELHKLLHAMGFTPGGCNCDAWRDRMNTWGVDGCREHRQEIIDHLESMKDSATLKDKLRAGVLAVANGLPLTIPGLVDEAIRRDDL